MREGRLFHDNKELVSVYYEDQLFGAGDVYVAEDVDAVFHPIAGNLRYNSAVLTQTQADADWRVILAEPNTAIEKTNTLVRDKDGDDEREFTIVDVLSFAGRTHLFVDEEGLDE